jgi:alanine racemase
MLYRSWIIKNPFQWEAWIIQRRFVPEGTPVGYNQRAHTVRPSILGVIPIGYSDGYPRSLSMKEMYVLVGETPCPIMGIISMNLTIIDITDASPHETCATLVGQHPHISLELISQKAGISSQVFLAGLDRHIPRLKSRPSGSVCQNGFL